MSDEGPDWRQQCQHEEQEQEEAFLARMGSKWPGVKTWPGRTKEPQMKSIASALVKAQKEFGPALKTNTNPHFKSKYADLSACVEAVIDALNNNGIALVQKTHKDDAGVTVETVFIHESGETLDCGVLHVPAAKQDPQGYGSALTYARRYSLMAACGIAPEDDDGNAASKGDLSKGGSVKHSPTDEAILLNPKRETTIKLAASLAVAKFKKGDQLGAYEEISGITEADEKLYLWQVLKAESALRAFIKKHAAELREQEAEPV
jgi:hypothetical protein